MALDNILDSFDAGTDFGWSFASDAEVNAKTSELQNKLQETKESSDDIKTLQLEINKIVEHQQSIDSILESNTKRIEKKLDQILTFTTEKLHAMITEQGSSMAELSSLICSSGNDALEEKYDVALKEKMRKIEQLILPFLKGLTKDPDKEYIRWANRLPFLEAKAKELIAITRDK